MVPRLPIVWIEGVPVTNRGWLPHRYDGQHLEFAVACVLHQQSLMHGETCYRDCPVRECGVVKNSMEEWKHA